MQSYLNPLLCDHCKLHITEFVPPEIPDQPSMIIVGESPGREEHNYRQEGYENGRPFVGMSGSVLREIVKKLGIEPIIVNARNTYLPDHKPTAEEVNSCREAHLLPILSAFPDLPVVGLGQYASQALLHNGNKSETSSVGKTVNMYDHTILFSYHPAYYLYENRDHRIYEHMETMLKSAIRPVEKLLYKTDLDGIDKWTDVVLDIEADRKEYPWYGSPVRLVGIKPLGQIPSIIAPKELTTTVRRILNTNIKTVIGHHLIYDLVGTGYLGLTFNQASFHDTLIYRKHSTYRELDYGLKYLVKKDFGFPPYEQFVSTKFDEHALTGQMDMSMVRDYNAWDLRATEALYLSQLARPRSFLLDMEYLRYVRNMTLNGIYTSKKELEKIGKAMIEEKESLERKLKRLGKVGKDFNFRSPKQVSSMLTQAVGPLKNTQKQTLMESGSDNPIISVLLDLRSLEKLSSTGIEGLIKRITDDSLIHSSMTPNGTKTSRLSSSAPNIQNLDPRVHPAFRSRFPNGKIISADLSQLEYRIIADAAHEYKLINIFLAGGDIHEELYKELFARASKTKEERKIAKTFNYAKIYGAGKKKTRFISKLPREESDRIFDIVKYEMVDKFREQLIKQLYRTKRITNLFGRTRIFADHELDDDKIEREAFNWYVQSSGHEVTKIFLMEIVDRLETVEVKTSMVDDVFGIVPIKEDAAVLANEVHDSVVFDVKPYTTKIVEEVIKSVSKDLNMLIEENFGVHMVVPLLADITVDKYLK